MRKLLHALALSLGVSGLFGCQGEKPASTQETKQTTSVAERLFALGYLQYADPADVDSLKAALEESLSSTGTLTSLWDEKTNTPKEYRLYFCDGEAVFEGDGYTDLLQTLQPTFSKMGAAMVVTDAVDSFSPDGTKLSRRITLNGHPYSVFKEFEGPGWGEAVQRFAEVVNHELDLQHKEERIYLVGGGNEGMLVFLTEPQFTLLDSHQADAAAKPLPTEAWCRAMEVEYAPITELR